MNCRSGCVTLKHQINSIHCCSISSLKLCSIWLCVATLSADLFLVLSSVCVIICNNTRQANGKVQRVPQAITHRPEKSCRLSSCGWQRFYLLCAEPVTVFDIILNIFPHRGCLLQLVLIYLFLACVFLFAEVYSCCLCQSRETLITILHGFLCEMGLLLSVHFQLDVCLFVFAPGLMLPCINCRTSQARTCLQHKCISLSRTIYLN